MSWRLPAGPAAGSFAVRSFLGADLTQASANISANRSPFCPNMIRESRGKVRKRTGYETVSRMDGRINGVYPFADENGEKYLCHAGTKLYLDGEAIYSDMNDALGQARQLAGKLCIFDGKKLLLFGKTDGEYKVTPAQDSAYIPKVLISKNPEGGGTALEPVNLLGSRRTESFLGKANIKLYQLSAADLDPDPVTVRKLNAGGTWDALTETTHFSVNRQTGQVTFITAPGASPVLGQDNLEITYSKTVPGYSDRINLCNTAVLYGVGGGRDRVFCTGNPREGNRDYYSGLNDPTYFGDLWYACLGQESSHIMGYSIVSDQLCAHLDRSDDGTNTILRRGALTNGAASFPLSGSFQGEGAVSRHGFAVLESEPLYLTRGNVLAVTPSDIIGERYAQGRGYYLQGALEQADLSESYAAVLDGFYFFTGGDKLFILDGTQPVYEKNEPYSSRQYEAYYWTDIPARVLFTRENALWFGTLDGRVCRFHRAFSEPDSFNDDGAPIYGAWRTPEFYGRSFYNRKDFRKIAVLLGSAVATGCRIWGFYEGEKELLLDYGSFARYFSFRNLTFSKLSFKTDRTPQRLLEKIKIKKVDKVEFLFENDKKNEPFALYEAAAEFTERE